MSRYLGFHKSSTGAGAESRGHRRLVLVPCESSEGLDEDDSFHARR
jgi:hypothetical protein